METTLEREWDNLRSLKEYYRLIYRAHHQIESITGSIWHLPDFAQLYDHVSKIGQHQIPALDYMVYLRHHGFPSPLLDWTFSPYIAAYFAFRKKTVNSGNNVAIFAYSEMPFGQKSTSNSPSIYSMDRKITTHRRHFLQQSKYTVCLKIERTLASNQSEPVTNVEFSSHESVFATADFSQDALYKFVLPSAERDKVLQVLDMHNLNAFSLFGSDEALMETLAFREFRLL